jgi:hypothetical protein
MAHEPVSVRTNKKISAARQIRAAIGHFHLQQYECAITLAGAGEGQSEPNMLDHAFNVLKRTFSATELNIYRNWLKHPTGPHEAVIDELEVIAALIRAIQKFVSTYRESHPDFEQFSQWAMQHGYIKRPLTEKAE